MEFEGNIKIRKNIISIGFFKGINIVLTFLLVPLTIRYIGAVEYGVWITLLSIFSWISLIEVGFGNGLRNRLSESLAKNNLKAARIYVSTAYLIMIIITILLVILTCLILPSISLQSALNTTYSITENTLKLLSLILIAGIGLNMALALFKSVAFSLQIPVVEASSQSLTLLISVLGIFLLLQNEFSSIIRLGVLYASGLIASSLVFSAIVFKKVPDIIPRFKYVSLKKTRPMMSLGFGYLVIQVSAMIIYSTDNIIISHILNPEYVTTYSTTMKLFMGFNLLQVIILTPLWSAYTDAYIKKELGWIKKTLLQMIVLMLPFAGLITLTAYHCQRLVAVWIGKTLNIQIPSTLIWFLALYTFLLLWNNIFGYLLSGIGKIRLSSIIFVFAAIINIPLSIYFAKYLEMGMAGIALGTICSLVPSSILSPIQTIYFIFVQSKSRHLNTLLS